MKAYRTPWWYFVLGCIGGFVLGAMSVSMTESSAIMAVSYTHLTLPTN